MDLRTLNSLFTVVGFTPSARLIRSHLSIDCSVISFTLKPLQIFSRWLMAAAALLLSPFSFFSKLPQESPFKSSKVVFSNSLEGRRPCVISPTFFFNYSLASVFLSVLADSL
jgi:hypothetical protein